MKFVWFFLFVCCIGLSSFAQPVNFTDVPEPVATTVDKMIPEGNILGWVNTDNGYYCFVDKIGDEKKLLINNAGEWQHTRTSVMKAELPKKIMDTIQLSWTPLGFAVQFIEFTELNDNRSFYLVELLNQETTERTELWFNTNGSFLEEIKKPELFVIADLSVQLLADKQHSIGKDVHPKTLPSRIDQYLMINYKRFYIRQSTYMKHPDHGFTYYLMLRKKDEKYPVELYFDKYGVLKHKSDPKDKANKEQQLELEKFLKASKSGDNIKVKELPSGIINFIDKNYDHLYKIKTSTLLSKEPLENHYYIVIRKEGEDDFIELFFDFYGKLVRKIEPIDRGTSELVAPGDENLEANLGGEMLPNTQLNEKELPSPVKEFIKKNYIGYKVGHAVYVENEIVAKGYFVEIKSQGKPRYSMYFDLFGELVKNSDEAYNKKMKELAKKKAKERPRYDQSIVPEIVIQTLLKKHRSASKIYFDTVNGNYVARFKLEEDKCAAEITPEGVWVSSTTVYPLERVNARIKDYLKKNYKGYKIEYAQYIKRADRKHKYRVVIAKTRQGETWRMATYFSTSNKFEGVINPWPTEDNWYIFKFPEKEEK